MKADLHFHSKYSDGTLWPVEMVQLGKEKGLVYLVGEFYISEKHRNPLISFRVSNSYSGSKKKIIIDPSPKNKRILKIKKIKQKLHDTTSSS